MYKWGIAGLLLAGLVTVLLAGPLLSWVQTFGDVPALVVAFVYRLFVLVLAVWLIVWLFQRRQESEPRL